MMKNLILSVTFLTFFLGLVIISCSKNEENTFINLDKKSIILTAQGERQTIKLTANGEWKTTNIPQWITVNPTSGEDSATITITATKNKEYGRRKASVTFTCGGINRVVEIEQLSLIEPNSIEVPTFVSDTRE